MLSFMGIEDYVTNYGETKISAKYDWNISALTRTNPLIRNGEYYGCCAIVPNATIAARMYFMKYGGGFVKTFTYDPNSYDIIYGRRYHNDFVHTIFAPKKILEEFFSRPRDQMESETGLFMYARSNDPYYIAATFCNTFANAAEQVNAEHIAGLLLGYMPKFQVDVNLIETYLSDM